MTPVDPSSLDHAVGSRLHTVITIHGLPLLSQPERLQAALAAQMPNAFTEVGIVLRALSAGVPQMLLSPPQGEPSMVTAMRVARQLAQDTSLDAKTADWAVYTWQQGLGLVASASTAPGLQVTAAPGMHAQVAPTQAAAVAAMRYAASPVVEVAASQPATKRPVPKNLIVASSVGALVLAAGVGWYTLAHKSLVVNNVRGTGNTLISDGKPQPVMLEFSAKNTDIKSVDVRYVRGDAQWAPTSWSVDAGASGKTAGEISAGSLSHRANTPVNATFEYTLVSKDGVRSAPFEQTFKFSPPVLITSAKLTNPPRLGQAYAVQLGYRKGAGDIVQVNRRVVDSTVPWPQPEVTMPVVINQASGSFDFAMDAPTQPMRSTVEFEMVDSLGVKSDPVRLAINVAVQPITSGPATVMHVALIKGNGAAQGAGALAGGAAGAAIGNNIGAGSGRTAATLLGVVGGALAGHAIEQRVRGPSLWETTVRFDDGNTRRIRHADQPRWQAGERVMVSGGAIQR